MDKKRIIQALQELKNETYFQQSAENFQYVFILIYTINVEYKEEAFNVGGETICLTSCDFVLKTEIKEPVVFDMELAFILAMGFRSVKSIKIVSDNLSLKQYEESTE